MVSVSAGKLQIGHVRIEAEAVMRAVPGYEGPGGQTAAAGAFDVADAAGGEELPSSNIDVA